ncbi:MAG: hypothetical protein EA417_01820 [Gammaproteobacteria bacterium]|nr:MAG: hypothetical protein EA417_01820 [Gammaproteobacteria bacterium]
MVLIDADRSFHAAMICRRSLHGLRPDGHQAPRTDQAFGLIRRDAHGAVTVPLTGDLAFRDHAVVRH